MAEYEVFNLDVAIDALRKAWEAHERGEDIVWDGPDRLHHSIAATCPPPSVILSTEYLKESLEDQGRDFFGEFLMIAFQLGYHNGVVRQEAHTDRAREDAEFYRGLYRDEVRKHL